MAREINLVPDVKNEMIKALKLRNFIFFLCIAVAAASAGITLVFGLILGGQQLALEGKKNTISNLSEKLNSYGDLNDFLTIKDQLGNLASITERKQVFTRTFGIISTLQPTNGDEIKITSLTVNFDSDAPTLSIEARADAKKAPYIDYNVLDSFKKGMDYVHYDYGDYVDKNGDTIPAYCIIENENSGAMFNDPEKGLYAYWLINGEGCNPSASDDEEDDSKSSTAGYNIESYDGQEVVRIWRTPQFAEWYKENPSEGQPSMSLDGTISNVPHFESACITYNGDDSKDSKNPKWGDNNDCILVRGGTEGLKITSSSNGRTESGSVLTFSATLQITPGYYNFNNHHVISIAPSGHHNVTDSYVQIQAMFGKRAEECAADDAACNQSGGGN